MPSRRGPKQPQPATALQGCIVAFSGRFRPKYDHSHSSLEEIVRALGGGVVKTAAASMTHLVCTGPDYTDVTAKVRTAKGQDVPIVGPEWLFACEKRQAAVAVDDFLWSAAPDGAAVKEEDGDDAGPSAAGNQRKKRPIAAVADSKANEDCPAKKLKAIDELQAEGGKVMAEGQFAKNKSVAIPVDSHCYLTAYRVHVDPRTGMIYDASLNQSSTSNNHNKFYRLQVRLDCSSTRALLY